MRLQLLRRACCVRFGPVVVLRECAMSRLYGGLRVLIRHLQEDQVGELLQIVAIAHAVVAQGVAETPDFLDEGGGVHRAILGCRLMREKAFMPSAARLDNFPVVRRQPNSLKFAPADKSCCVPQTFPSIGWLESEEIGVTGAAFFIALNRANTLSRRQSARRIPSTRPSRCARTCGTHPSRTNPPPASLRSRANVRVKSSAAHHRQHGIQSIAQILVEIRHFILVLRAIHNQRHDTAHGSQIDLLQQKTRNVVV